MSTWVQQQSCRDAEAYRTLKLVECHVLEDQIPGQFCLLMSDAFFPTTEQTDLMDHV